MHLDSLAVHAGRTPGHREPLAPPIVQASVHVFEDLEDYDRVASGDRAGFFYGRNSNENVEMLARAVADLEGAEAGLAVASGMAAIFATVLAAAPQPAPLVVDRDGYGVTLTLLRKELSPLGYEVREVDMGDLKALRQALAGAALLICETITNPLSKVADLDAICSLAGAAGVTVLVDNTYATPVLCRPLELGAAAVCHSATKYLGGHSDLTAGVVVGEPGLITEARAHSIRTGSSLGPFEAWLALRGLRTLPLRVRRQSRTALTLANGLLSTPGVERVHHPLLRASPHRPVAARLLPQGAGGMLAFDLAGGREAVQAMVRRFRMVRFAASFGGVKTTVSYPELTSHRGLTASERRALGIFSGTVRVSSGLEDPGDLLEDLRQAISG